MTEAGGIRAGGRRFQPTLGATVAALTGILILVALGLWQVQRLQSKTALIAERTARVEAPATALPAAFGDPGELTFRRFALSGRFRHGQELYLGARTRRGRVGFHVITPFELSDGRVVLVDRGWVPPGHKDPATRPEGQIAGPVSLEGRARRGGWKGNPWFRPDNDPAENLWLWLDPAAMGLRIGEAEMVTELFLEYVGAAPPGGLPRPAAEQGQPRNDHLQYAITWFALAGILAIIYLVFHFRPVGPES